MQLEKITRNFARLAAERKIYAYRPYGHPDTLCPDGALWKINAKAGQWGAWSNKPWQSQFHAAGASHKERMLLGANRPGKTEAPAAEIAMHLTGEYPDWWQGRRFHKPIEAWCCSPTNEVSRDVVQKKLLGGLDDALGTGYIPKAKIVGKPQTRQCGISSVADRVRVRHVSGGTSICAFKSYEQGWRKFQGTEPEVIWMDEEPDESDQQSRIFSECQTRLLTSHGIMMVTLTPLLGHTTLVNHFLKGGEGIYIDYATWDDAPHLLEDAKRQLRGSYPASEIETRTRGVPMMGEGRVFQTDEADISVMPFQIPEHWPRIKGIDFGVGHKSAYAEIAWDRDHDVIYVTRAWGKVCAVEEHAGEINRHDPWVPVAWPHDGVNKEKSGKRVKDLYLPYGVKMLGMSARYKNDDGGSQPVEPIVLECDLRMRAGGFKVFKTCIDFFDEYRLYHRKNGVINPVRDDVLKAVFYAVMMRRYAQVRGLVNYQPPPASAGMSMRIN